MQELQTLDDIFNKRLFRIPDYQRGYAWREQQLIEFWEDILHLDGDRQHYFGVLSIKAVPNDTIAQWQDEKWLIQGEKYKPAFVVDGQQRLTTIIIFIQCLIETVRNTSANQMKEDSDIYLGAYSLSRIIEQYLVATEPRLGITHTYKFGYETDNPSFDFMRYRIFNEKNAGTLKETFYTLNLENAKTFFKDNLNNFARLRGLDALTSLFGKVTTRLMFNLYEIGDDLDVFVAFETMNNRGKSLSNLELLKNRLIYLTTLYPPAVVPTDAKQVIRKKINDTWGEIYNQLGRNKKAPLNDDDFLRAHWIMYFKYSRRKGSDYIDFLLKEQFTPKHILGDICTSTAQIDYISESIEFTDDDEPFENQNQQTSPKEKLTIGAINDYVESLRVAARYWYATHFPADTDELAADEQIQMDKINRVKIAYFRPLIMTCLIKTSKQDKQRINLLKAIERFIFVGFRVCRSQSNYRSSVYFSAASD